MIVKIASGENDMGLEKLIKREISITIATVLLVTTIFIMFSYAIFKVEDEGDPNTITFGKIEMAFCKDATCNDKLTNIGNIIGTKTVDGVSSYVPIYPQTLPIDYDSLEPYIFTLTNTGDLPLYVKVYLERDETPGIPLTHDGKQYSEKVDNNQIQVAFGEQGVDPTSKNYEEVANAENLLADSITLNAKQTKTFRLYAWLVPDAQNSSQGKIFVTKISARGEYIPEQ